MPAGRIAWIYARLLSVPYLLEARGRRSQRGANGSCGSPILNYPDCIAEGFVVEDVLKELEQRRIEIIVGLVEEGRQPPVPRKPLATPDPLWTVRDLGLSARVAVLLGSATKSIP